MSVKWEVGGDLGLDLIIYDTSQLEDLVLQEEMVEMGRAVFIQTF